VVVVAVQADALDLEVVEVVDQVAVVDALVIAVGVILALVAVGVAVDAKEDVLHLVKGVGNRAVGAVGARDHVKDAQDAPDAEDLVLVHVHRQERVRLVPHAIVVLAVLVRVLHVHLVEDALDQVDAEAIAMGAMLAVMGLVKLLALVIAVGAKDHVNQHVQQDAKAVLVVLEDVAVVLEDVAVVLVVVRDVMVVVMNAVDNVKTHVLLPAQQRVLVHVKLKRLVP
jgi:hypothetical protein